MIYNDFNINNNVNSSPDFLLYESLNLDQIPIDVYFRMETNMKIVLKCIFYLDYLIPTPIYSPTPPKSDTQPESPIVYKLYNILNVLIQFCES